MKIVEKADATATLAEYTAEIAAGAIIVTNDGRPVAALVPIENADLETVSLSTNREFLELIERSRTRTIADGAISSEEMRARFG
jgi:antitoxin (DNA-binding transcriptional repressor) of toxin-antitoxin stability system